MPKSCKGSRLGLCRFVTTSNEVNTNKLASISHELAFLQVDGSVVVFEDLEYCAEVCEKLFHSSAEQKNIVDNDFASDILDTSFAASSSHWLFNVFIIVTKVAVLFSAPMGISFHLFFPSGVKKANRVRASFSAKICQ